MKLTLLLIPILFLSSCVRGNPTHESTENKPMDYYDALSTECMQLKDVEQGGCITSVKWMEKNNFQEASGGNCPAGTTRNTNKTLGSKKWCEPGAKTITSPCMPGMYPTSTGGCSTTHTPCPPGQTLTGFPGTEFCVTLSELGSGFTLSQTDDMTRLTYNDAILKTWETIVSPTVPEIYNDECSRSVFVSVHGPLLHEGYPTKEAQSLWDTASTLQKKSCVNEKFRKSISIYPTNTPKYANLLIGKYEGGDSHLINMEQGKILFEIPSGEAKKVTENGTTLTVLVAGIYAPNMFYTYDTEKQEIISKENIDDQKYAELLK